jgi:hypothetical protein
MLGLQIFLGLNERIAASRGEMQMAAFGSEGARGGEANAF